MLWTSSVSLRAGAPVGLPGALHGLRGGGGLAHWIVRLLIWHAIWRFLHRIWAIHTFGPIIIVVVIVAVVAVVVVRTRRGSWSRRTGSGTLRTGSGRGPRDW